MPNPDDIQFQQQMVDALMEAFPEDVPATQVKARTGISDSTVGRWRDPDQGPSFPLREPVKSSLYQWYTDTGGGAAPVQETGAPRDDFYRELARIIRQAGGDLYAVQGALFDLALAMRADALRLQEQTAARRQQELAERRVREPATEDVQPVEKRSRKGVGRVEG